MPTATLTAPEARPASFSLRAAPLSRPVSRMVSTPCWELFDKQPEAYKAQVIGPAPVRVAVEAAASFGWTKFIGENGAFVGMNGFGASAPAEKLFEHFGVTAQAVAAAAKAKLG